MQNRDFVSFLVDETFELQNSGEGKLSSLELKLTDYGLSFMKGGFIPQTRMLRFESPFGSLDVPVNWTIFSANNATNDFVVLSDEDDRDHLLSIMKASWKIQLEKLLIIHADGFCYIVGLRAGDEVHLHDLTNPQEWLKVA